MKQFRLSGSGGQGLITLGIILAEAAVMDNKRAIQSQSYGPEARGGSSKAEVIISDKIIHYPKVIGPDIVLAMTEEAVVKYTTDLKSDGILITDTQFVRKLPELKNFTGKIYELPITATAKNELGRELFANIVALGALNEIAKAVSKEAVIAAVLNKVPAGTEDKNKKALELGASLVK